MRHRFPEMIQMDSTDCGPTCLRMVAKFYGRDYSLAMLRECCHITREGVSLLGISDAAESIGFRTLGVKIGWHQFLKEMPLPSIVHWNQCHFVVVYDILRHRHKTIVRVADPARGLLEYEEADFLNCWLEDCDEQSGIALVIEPTPTFYDGHSNETIRHYGFRYILSYLRPYRAYIVQILLAMAVASLISLMLPFITQAMVDRGIGTGNLSFIVALLIAQFFLTLGSMANGFVRGWLMLHTTTRVSISLISDFLCKLMKLPISFFDSKMVGDILQRIGDHGRIQTFLTGSLLSMLVAIVSFIVYGAVMAEYNMLILGIFLIGTAIYMLWVLFFLKKRRKLDYMRFQQSSVNQSNLVQLINGMQDIKLNGCEKQRRWDWEYIQARLFKISVKNLNLGQVQEVGSTFIDQTKNILISFIAAKSVVDGNMTLGMMMALQYIMGQMNAPVSHFISFVRSAQDASISIERLGEIQEMRDEEPEDEPRIREIPCNADIVFRNVSFSYAGSDNVLCGINLIIPSGKVTAIVGASGSGKTTMLKMLLRFYHPSEGAILLYDRDLREYSESAWRRSCGAVMQDGYIFSDTIAANIAVLADMPDMLRVKKAADTANISNWVESLPFGYSTRIGADGHGLSAGQKQRILIARAAYKSANYLFFDEATNSLDASNEKSIMGKLETLFEGRTVVIVAHRLSTVRNADNIVVLDKGRIAEQGDHATLVAKKGIYYHLVRNQLDGKISNNAHDSENEFVETL